MKKLFAILAVAMSLTACQPNIPQVPQVLGDAAQQAAPAAQQSGISPLGAGIAGAAVGYLAGKAGSNNSGGHTVIERDRYVGGNSGYGNSYNRPRTTTTVTTVKKGLFGGSKVTRTVRRSR